MADGGRSTGCFYKVVDSEHDPERSTWQLGVLKRGSPTSLVLQILLQERRIGVRSCTRAQWGRGTADVPDSTLLRSVRGTSGIV